MYHHNIKDENQSKKAPFSEFVITFMCFSPLTFSAFFQEQLAAQNSGLAYCGGQLRAGSVRILSEFGI
ncbi:hypothetical protein DXX93_11190 [Thalassotalea euphylliae]|uniref:Uncharacterized protein n=1 Tax=Thalassotalea euphylliae TaxID=1655234 RepID=A0A3E0TRG8_9GAMM|nr:hypothetical protein [Thalassotalea euphylliae]REL27073.1 hypothetical protein DXX93_11190 [Thalassotalea euphylliae]